jgi:hypothetical protein
MYCSPLSRPQLQYRLVNETLSERQAASAARRRARPTKPSPSRAHTVTMTRGLRSEHVCTVPYTFSRTTHVEPRIACGPDKSSGNGLSSPGGYSTPSSTAKNVKPTSTSGFDSCVQLTSLSPFNRVCKPQKPTRRCRGMTRALRSTNAPRA